MAVSSSRTPCVPASGVSLTATQCVCAAVPLQHSVWVKRDTEVRTQNERPLRRRLIIRRALQGIRVLELWAQAGELSAGPLTRTERAARATRRPTLGARPVFVGASWPCGKGQIYSPKRTSECDDERCVDLLMQFPTHTSRMHDVTRTHAPTFVIFPRGVTRQCYKTVHVKKNCTPCARSTSLGTAHGAAANKPGPRDRDPPTRR